MTNNDILRRIRYAFDFDDAKMMALFTLAEHQVTRTQISAWLKKDDDPAFVECSESELALFLDGLIYDRRGKKEGPQPAPDLRLNNNIIFRKLRIALNLKDEGVLSILALAGFPITKPELSALFRKPDNRHFRVCKDQILRNFIKGMQMKYRSQRQPRMHTK
ncbi:MAG: DUF1456 family protein [Mariprofundus sp.]